MVALGEGHSQLNMKKCHRAGRQLSSPSQGPIHLPHPGCSNLRLYSCSEANKVGPQNTARQRCRHGLSSSDATGVITASPLGGGGHALRHTLEETRQVISTWALRGILHKALHARAPPLLPLPAVWPPPEQLLPHPCPARLQRVMQRRERHVSWIQDQQRTAMVPVPLGIFVWRQQRRPMETPQQALRQEDFSQLQEPTAATTAIANTQLPLISHACFSYTSVTTPATTLSPTGHLFHDTRASSRFCHVNSVHGHCFHRDLKGCSRHVSP